MQERILAVRQAENWSQEELAKKIGRTRSAVAQWEGGKTRPRHSTLVKISDISGVELVWLESGINRNGSSNPKLPSLSDGSRDSEIYRAAVESVDHIQKVIGKKILPEIRHELINHMIKKFRHFSEQ